jgi:hypothetical protein
MGFCTQCNFKKVEKASKEVTMLQLDNNMISSFRAMERLVATKAISSKPPINHGFIVDLQVLELHHL